METRVKQNLIRLGVRKGMTLGIAVSGGVDSMVLLDIVAGLRDELGIVVEAYHFEHGIRDQASKDDMAFVEMQCDMRGITCITDSANVPYLAKERGVSVETAARQVRYDFLDKQSADFIATAHHMDDTAETVIMNLVRGSGIKGLGGIPEKRGRYIRPMLSVLRMQIEDYARENGIAFVHDSTNDDTGYTRNYIRHEILPRFCNINDGACANIARTASLLREDADALAQMAEDAGGIEVREDGVYIDMAALATQHIAIKKRIVRRAIAEATGLRDIENVHVKSVLDIAHKAESGKRVDIGGGLFAVVVYDKLMIGKNLRVGYNNALVPMDGVGCYDAFGKVFTCAAVCGTPKYGDGECFDADVVRGAVFRHRRQGDVIMPLGMRGTKRLSDYLSDRKVPLHMRNSLILLVKGSEVYWVVGVGVSEKSKAKDGHEIFKITYREN